MTFEGITALTGQNNILLLAPHGNMRDDMGTAEFARDARNNLNCYALINSRFRRGKETAYQKNIADLYKKEAFLHPDLKPLFWLKVTRLLDDILSQHDKALVLHIHGIKDKNIEKIAAISNGNLNKSNLPLHLIIGFGQHFKNPRLTANENLLVSPLIQSFTNNGINALAAPTDPIYNNGHKTWYCGNDRRRMNQYLFNHDKYRNKLESLQIELKYTGIRDNEGRLEATYRFAQAVRAVWN